MQLVEDDVAQVREEARASLPAISRASCSGVVRRMSGGFSFWRWRRTCEVSPVRVSSVTFRPISSTGRSRLRAMSVASAFSGEM